MCNQTTSPDTASATSSPASEDGPSQLDLLDGPTIENCGPAPRRASRSRSRAKAKRRLTIGTCGPTFFDSPVPDCPLSSWENRLRRRLARTGSTECSLTWKASATPAGRQLSRLVPSGHRTGATGSGLLPTPSGTSNHGRNHVSGRLDEWGGSSNPWRGTETGKVHCVPFELWMMGYSAAWAEQMPREMPSSRKSRPK